MVLEKVSAIYRCPLCIGYYIKGNYRGQKAWCKGLKYNNKTRYNFHSDNHFHLGIIHKGCLQFGIIGTSPTPVQVCPHLVDHPPSPTPNPLPLSVWTQGCIIWNIVTCERFTQKKTDHSDTGCTHLCVPIRQFG